MTPSEPLGVLGVVNQPLIRVRLVVNGTSSASVTGLVDSGACYTLVNSEIGTQLGLKWRDGRRLETVGLGGTGHAFESPSPIDIYLGKAGKIVLLRSTVFFADIPARLKLPHVVLGQRDALEQLGFVHLNQVDEPRFELHARRTTSRLQEAEKL